MRRFDQFIRHAGHFGKPAAHLNAIHQIGKRFLDRSKHCFRRWENLRPIFERKHEMSGNENNLQSRQIVAVFFALVSGISAVSTAVLPGVLHF
jgi:hypothetical protein